jgi:hypothetical protein
MVVAFLELFTHYLLYYLRHIYLDIIIVILMKYYFRYYLIKMNKN